MFIEQATTYGSRQLEGCIDELFKHANYSPSLSSSNFSVNKHCDTCATVYSILKCDSYIFFFSYLVLITVNSDNLANYEEQVERDRCEGNRDYGIRTRL